MSKLSYSQLVSACEAGGPTALSLVTELTPAGGPQAAVAPARYVAGRNVPTFGYETRFVDGEPVLVVMIDQKQSQLNRVEAAIIQSIRDEHPLLSRVPRVQVSYDEGRVVYTDLELPQRIYDGHIRAGTVDGIPVTDHPAYRAARDSSPANARVLIELSPGSLVFGAWDSTRKARQGRYRSALVGEIIGVLADQQAGATVTADEPSADPGLGSTPPTLHKPGVVSCRRIIRTQVLSFAALRQLRFDAGPAGDASCRAVLAAYALAGVTRSNAELSIRANCDLVEAAPTAVKLDARNGDFLALEVPSIEEADQLLEQALDEAKREADIQWRGQVFRVVGSPAGYAAAQVEADGGSAAAKHASWWSRLVGGRRLGGHR